MVAELTVDQINTNTGTATGILLPLVQYASPGTTTHIPPCC